MNIKTALFKQCQKFVNDRLEIVNNVITSNQNALQSETKSSAGDKHETGRAMLQLEMEKAGQQLAGINEMKIVLSKINASIKSEIIHLGSVIETDSVNYFLSISAGKLNINNEEFFAISVSSPIGKLLLGKKKGDIITLNNKKIKVVDIR